jgi:hypothetical protein
VLNAHVSVFYNDKVSKHRFGEQEVSRGLILSAYAVLELKMARRLKDSDAHVKTRQNKIFGQVVKPLAVSAMF